MAAFFRNILYLVQTPRNIVAVKNILIQHEEDMLRECSNNNRKLVFKFLFIL